MTNPVYAYDHNTGCTAVTGGAFVPNGVWPAAFDNTYLYGDFVCGKIIRLTPAAGGGFTAADFVTGLGTNSITTLKFGPYGSTQAAYYLNYLNGGEVRRIAFTGTANRAPTAVATANKTSGPTPLAVAIRRAREQRSRRRPADLRLELRRRLGARDGIHCRAHVLDGGDVHGDADGQGRPRGPGQRDDPHRRGQHRAGPGHLLTVGHQDLRRRRDDHLARERHRSAGRNALQREALVGRDQASRHAHASIPAGHDRQRHPDRRTRPGGLRRNRHHLSGDPAHRHRFAGPVRNGDEEPLSGEGADHTGNRPAGPAAGRERHHGHRPDDRHLVEGLHAERERGHSGRRGGQVVDLRGMVRRWRCVARDHDAEHGHDLHGDVHLLGAVPRRLRAREPVALEQQHRPDRPAAGGLRRFVRGARDEYGAGHLRERATRLDPDRSCTTASGSRSSARPPTTSPSASSAPQPGARSSRSTARAPAGSASATRSRPPASARRPNRRSVRGTRCRCTPVSGARA